MAFRGCIPDFQLANPLYIGATVNFYTVDDTGHATTSLATLYSDPTSNNQALNPQTLDSEGKFFAPVYIEEPVIAQVIGPNVESSTTGVINARGTWRGNWATDTVYFSSDFVQDPSSGNVYAAALDYTSSSTLAADVAAGDLILVLALSSIIGSIAVKQACLVATTANITLSGTQTIDGVALAVGERVLVKNQSTASQNGIYVVQSGAWTLATDFNASSQVFSGCRVFITTGTVNALTEWEITTADPITLGTTALTWSNNRTAIGTWTFSGTLNVTGTFEKSGTAQTFPASGLLVGTTDTQTLTGKTISGGTLSGTIAGTPTLSGANFIAQSNIAQAGAYTLNGNPTNATANHADFTLGSLTAKTVPVGADQLLIADSAAGDALKVSTVSQVLAGAASAMVLLNTLPASNSPNLSDTTSLTSAYSSYLIVLENLIPATNGVNFELQFQVGGTFQTSGYVGGFAGGTSSGSSAFNNTGSYISLGSGSNIFNGAPGLSGELRIFGPSAAAIIQCTGSVISATSSSAAAYGSIGAYYNSSGPITGIKIVPTTGNITSGTVKIYGIT